MANPIKTLEQDYEWIHLSLGLAGNVMFLAGSVLFLPAFEQQNPDAGLIDMKWQTVGVWLFIFGAFFMFHVHRRLRQPAREALPEGGL